MQLDDSRWGAKTQGIDLPQLRLLIDQDDDEVFVLRPADLLVALANTSALQLSAAPEEGGELLGVLLRAAPSGDAKALGTHGDSERSELRRALAQERWRRAQAQRHAADLEFLAGAVSHDLRAPLGCTRQLLAQLGQRVAPTDAEAARLLGIASDGAGRMEATTVGLADYMRACGEPDDVCVVDPTAVFKAVWEEGADNPVQRRARLVVPPLPDCVATEAGLRRAAVMLLANALKY